MNLLVISLNFFPELTGIGKYSGEMAFWLADRGHNVRVICAPPYYPNWKIEFGYSSVFYRSERISGVDVIRCPLWVPRVPSGLKRLIHLISFSFSCLPQVLIQVLKSRPDAIMVVAPSLFSAPVAIFASFLSRSPSWLHIQDYEVDAAFDLGILKGDVVKSFVLGMEKWLLNSFDRVSTISNKMLDRAISKGVCSKKVVLFQNWVDVKSIMPGEAEGYFRRKLSIPSRAVVALYSGNMGGKQGLDILAEVAILSKSENRLFFVFCGNGSGRSELEVLCDGLDNVRFIDLQPLELLGELLNTADIHLLPQRADAADLVMPSKLTGMLASGRPVIATANPNTEVAQVLKECGLVVPPEQPCDFFKAIISLVDDPKLRKKLGDEARNYAENNLDRDAVLMKFESDLNEIVIVQ